MLGCGIYCPRDPRNRAQRRCPLRGRTALGNRPTLADLRSSRYLGSPNLCYRVPLSGVGRAFLAALATVMPTTDFDPMGATRSLTHHRSARWSHHPVSVRRVFCQLGCMDVWQTRHERTYNASKNLLFGQRRVSEARWLRTKAWENKSLYPHARSCFYEGF